MRRLALLLALLSLPGCGFDLCARAKRLNETFQQRHADCFAEGTLPAASFDAATCQGSMTACTDQDEAAIAAYFDCVEKLPVCTHGDVSAFNEKLLGCAKGMNGLSEGCFR